MSSLDKFQEALLQGSPRLVRAVVMHPDDVSSTIRELARTTQAPIVNAEGQIMIFGVPVHSDASVPRGKVYVLQSEAYFLNMERHPEPTTKENPTLWEHIMDDE